jgi:predicted phage terminase large subunit-like protein
MANTNERLIRHLQAQDALLRVQAEKSLRRYVEQAWPVLEPDVPFIPNWHIDYLAEYLEAVTAGEITRLLINIPPRYMKSLLVSVLWPTWEWIQDPSRRWIFASYADALASKHSVDRRTVLQSEWYQRRWGNQVKLASDQNVKSEFQNTRRGHMIATSIGGSITGKGGSRIVVDDPHNPTQAESDTQRESALTYFSRTLSTRLDNKNTDAIVVVMQRLHERDLSALCLDLGFTHVCLPAEAEIETTHTFPRTQRVHNRLPGDVLWPEREGRPVLEKQRVLLGSAGYSGQYQQRPAPAGGLIFQRDWFKFYDDLPHPMGTWAQSWDMTFKDGASSDYVVGLVAARKGADIYLVDRVKGKWAFNESCRQVAAFKQRYPKTGKIYIEDAANGPAIINALGRHVQGIIAVRPDGGKQARAQAAQPLVEAGNVWLPNPRPHGRLIPERAWVEDFLHQCCAFPTASYDDDVDALTQLVAQWLQPEPTYRIRRPDIGRPGTPWFPGS